MNRLLVALLLCASVWGQSPILVPSGFWPLCAAVSDINQTNPLCVRYAPGRETYMMQVSPKSTAAVAFIYTISVVLTDGTPVMITNVALRADGPNGLTAIGPLKFGGVVGSVVQITVDDLFK